MEDKLKKILVQHRSYDITTERTAKEILALFGVWQSLPLAEMEQKLNKLTKEETKEELEKWFKYKRQC